MGEKRCHTAVLGGLGSHGWGVGYSWGPAPGLVGSVVVSSPSASSRKQGTRHTLPKSEEDIQTDRWMHGQAEGGSRSPGTLTGRETKPESVAQRNSLGHYRTQPWSSPQPLVTASVPTTLFLFPSVAFLGYLDDYVLCVPDLGCHAGVPGPCGNCGHSVRLGARQRA